MRALLSSLLLLSTTALATQPRSKVRAAPAPAAATTEEPSALQRPTRIEFLDPRQVTGQTNRAGGVYLYDRKALKVRSMVKLRDDFRDEIVLP